MASVWPVEMSVRFAAISARVLCRVDCAAEVSPVAASVWLENAATAARRRASASGPLDGQLLRVLRAGAHALGAVLAGARVAHRAVGEHADDVLDAGRGGDAAVEQAALLVAAAERARHAL